MSNDQIAFGLAMLLWLLSEVARMIERRRYRELKDVVRQMIFCERMPRTGEKAADYFEQLEVDRLGYERVCTILYKERDR